MSEPGQLDPKEAAFMRLVERTQVAGVRDMLLLNKTKLVDNEVVSEEALQSLTQRDLEEYGLTRSAAGALKVAFPTPPTAGAGGVAGESGVRGGPAGVQQPGNAREQLGQHLVPGELQAIPDLNALQQLFSTPGNYKVPVSHTCKHQYHSSAAGGMLVGVAESPLTYVTNFLVAGLHVPNSNAAESGSTTLIQSFLTNLFALFSEYWPHGVSFAYEELHNQVESSTAVPSTIKSTRLDTMIVSTERRIAVFFGEDKRSGGLDAVKADLKSKLLKLPLTYLGHDTLRYHLAYTIEGRMVRLHAATFIMHQNNVQVNLQALGRACDLSTHAGRALLIIQFAKVYTVLECIVRSLPECKAVFPHGRMIKTASDHGWQSTLQFGLNQVAKTITGFKEYCAYFHTSKSIIDKAYKAAKDAERALPQGASQYMVPGTVSAKRAASDKDMLSTTMEVVGMQQAPETEEEVQDLAAACCLTAQQLHSRMVVYKDWRSQNVVRHVDTKDHMVVDLESVSAARTRIAPEHVLPSWGAHALQGQCFTKASDMYQIGLLINGNLRHLEDLHVNVSRDAHAWVELLTCEDPAARMTAETALEHAWLAGTKRRRLCQQAH